MTHWNCRYWQKKLADYATLEQAVPNDSALGRHLQRCAVCQDYYQEIFEAKERLSLALSAPTLSEGFEERLWTRLQANPNPISLKPNRMPLYVTGMALAGGAFVLWSRTQGVPAPTQIAIAPMRVTKPVLKRELFTKSVAEPLLPTPSPKRTVWLVESKRRTVHHSRPRRLRQVAAVIPVKQPKLQRVSARNWGLMGAWYATVGEYRQASLAYGQAWSQAPDPRTAFVAGQTAELAGDTSQALEFYARSLAPQPQAENPKERKDKKDDRSSSNPHRRYCGTVRDDNNNVSESTGRDTDTRSGHTSDYCIGGCYRYACPASSRLSLSEPLQEDEGDFCATGASRA